MPARGVQRVARAAAVAPVEGQKARRRAVEPRRHVHLAVAHGEVREGPARKAQQRFRSQPLGVRKTVLPVLVEGVVDALREVRLELHRRHRHAVEEQHQVDAVLVGDGVPKLPHHAQPVLPVARDDVGVHGEGGLELRELHRTLHAEKLDAGAQHVEGAPLVELIAQPREQRLTGEAAVVLLEGRPGRRLRRLHPRERVGHEERTGAVVERRVAGGVEPAVGGEVRADLVLEGDLSVEVH